MHSPYRSKSITEESQGRNLEADPEAETMEDACLLLHPLWFAQLAFLSSPPA